MTIAHRPWTSAEDAKLRELHAQGLNNQDKAQALGRTFHGTKKRVTRLGLANWRSKPWTPKEIAVLKRMVKSGELRKKISKKLNRCLCTIKFKISALGLGKPKNCRPWTKGEVKTLRTLKANGLPILEIAQRLNRTKPQVRGKLDQLGLVKRRKGGWTTKEIDSVRDWQEEGVPGAEQARRLGRTYNAWANIVQRWRLQQRRDSFNQQDVEFRLGVIKWIGVGFTPKQTAAKLERKVLSVNWMIRKLMKDGIIVKLGHKGPYKLTTKWSRKDSDD